MRQTGHQHKSGFRRSVRVEGCVTGLTVPPADSMSLAMAINKLLDDNELRSRYAEAARKRIHQEFKLDTMFKNLPALRPALQSPELINAEGFNRQYALSANALDKTSF